MQRAVAAKRADLQRAPRARRLGEDLEQAAELRRHLDGAEASRGRSLERGLQLRVGRAEEVANVRGDGRAGCVHQGCLPARRLRTPTHSQQRR